MPGTVFVLWGLHWMQGIFRNHFASLRPKGPAYRSQATHALPPFPRSAEAVCKVVLPLAAMATELYFAHRGGYRNLLCPPGSERAGHLQGNHLNNWQHAAMYPAFVLSGLVDLVGFEVGLPEGTQQAFLFAAFLCEALLMGLHKKHTPLDTMVHAILAGTMAANALAVGLELLRPASLLASCGRVAATLVQGGWFWAAARIMLEGRPEWDEQGGRDMAPVMLAPVLLVLVIVCVLGSMLVAFLCFHVYYKVREAQEVAAEDAERAGLLADPEASLHALSAHGGERAVALAAVVTHGSAVTASRCAAM